MDERPLLPEQVADEPGRSDRPASHLAEDIRLATESDSVRDRALADKEKIEEPECRYCKEGASAGPLIAPCNCNGSLQYVHPEPCLRLWLETRQGVGPPACEICNCRYEIEHIERCVCDRTKVCSTQSCESYRELMGIVVMMGCLVTTLRVLYQHRNDDRRGFDSTTNYAVMICLGLVLFGASLAGAKQIVHRIRRNYVISTVQPRVLGRPAPIGQSSLSQNQSGGTDRNC